MVDVEATAKHWLRKAAEARAKAERMRTSYGRSIMLEEAKKYERLAKEAKVHSRKQTKPTKGHS
jgi:hypothetical protein